MLAKIAEVRAKLHETFGKVTLALLSTPRYRNLAISDLTQLVLDPMMRDRIAIASSAKDGAPVEGTLSGIAFWASVSEAVDAKIREQIRAGTFPVRLQPEDWNSGTINWLLDVIAPNQRLTTAVIANFRQVLPKTDTTGALGDLRIHPIVTRLVDAETLKKMGAAPIKAGEAGAAAGTAQTSGPGGFPKM
ncbi:MAG: toxin-activating lysine-acyltransferase [Hyphomicrobium sp.]